jgi:hypothetical protein
LLPQLPGLVWVSEPVLVLAVPVIGVEPAVESPAVASDVLPVEAEADDPPVPVALDEVVEFVLVVALAEPPLVAVGEGVGVVGDGVGVMGDGVGLGAGVVVPGWFCDPPLCAFPCDPVPAFVAVGVGLGAGVGVGAGAGVGVGCGVALLAEVVVVEVVEVVDEPPLIDGFTLMIG